MSDGDRLVIAGRTHAPITPLPDHLRPGDLVLGELGPGIPAPEDGLIVVDVIWTGAGNRWSRTIGLDPVRPGEGRHAARRRILQAGGYLP